MSRKMTPEEYKKLEGVTSEFDEATHRGLIESPDDILEDVNMKAIESLPWDSVEQKNGGPKKDQEETRGDKELDDIAVIYNELRQETISRLKTLHERQHPAVEAYNKYFAGLNNVTVAANEMYKAKSWSKEVFYRWVKGQLVMLQMLHAELGKLIDKHE